MHRSIAFVVAAVFIVACSSNSDDAPRCPVSGSYALTSIPASLTYPETQDGRTVDIRGLGGGRYDIWLSGLGVCPLQVIGECRTYGTCEIAGGTIQVAWEFHPLGFEGSTYFIAPGGHTQITTSIALRK